MAFFAAIERGDAECERRVRYLCESGLLHLLAKLFAPNESFDRTVEVAVCLLVVAHQRADVRQNVAEIEVVAPRNEAILRVRKFENQHLAAWAQHAEHLFQTLAQIRKIAAAETARYRIERPVVERHGECRCFAKGDVESLRFLCTDAHHFGRQVDADNARCLVLAHDFEAQIARADGHVECFGAGTHCGGQAAAPAFVDVERQQVVERVVGAGNAIEQGANVLFLFRFVHSFGSVPNLSAKVLNKSVADEHCS